MVKVAQGAAILLKSTLEAQYLHLKGIIPCAGNSPGEKGAGFVAAGL
jgi:hypothetical protein